MRLDSELPPASLGLALPGVRVEDLRIDTRDGEELGAWYLAAPGARVSVIVLHRLGGSRSAEADLVRRLAGEGVNVLAPSLRAHGDSSGSTIDFGWGSREDLIACVELLELRAPGTRIVVFGESLGAAAAIYAAGDLDHKVAAYVLESPYRDIRTATRRRLARYLPPVLDRVAYAGLLLWSPVMMGARIGALSPLERAADIPQDVPVWFLAGTEDSRAPVAEVEEIRARCGDHARLVEFQGAAHVPLQFADPEKFRQVMREAIAAAGR